jgi:hypothetical protein
MKETFFEEPVEFTDEQLRAALHRMGEEARREAFEAGLTVTIVRSGHLIRQFVDGHEEDLGLIESANGRGDR